MAYKIQLGDATYGGAQSYDSLITVQDDTVTGSIITATGDLAITANGNTDSVSMTKTTGVISAYDYEIAHASGNPANACAIELDNDGDSMNRVRVRLNSSATAGGTLGASNTGANSVATLDLRKADGSAIITCNDGALSASHNIALAGGLTVGGNMSMTANTTLIIATGGNDTKFDGSYSVQDKIIMINDGAGSNGDGARISFGGSTSNNTGACLKYVHADTAARGQPTWAVLDGAGANADVALSASAWIGDGSALTSTGLTGTADTLAATGGAGSPITANTTLTQGGIFFVDISGGNVELTLPSTADVFEGRVLRFKIVAHSAGNHLRLLRAGSDTIDGALTSMDIVSADASVDLVQGKMDSGAAIYHLF